MKNLFKKFPLLGIALTPTLAFAEDPKLIQFAENTDKLGSAFGSSVYTWMYVIALVLLLAGVGGWAWSSKSQSNAPAGTGKFAMICFIAACVLFGGTKWMSMGNEMAGETGITVDYRNLQDQASN